MVLRERTREREGGMQEQLKQPAIKIFYFENDRLVTVSDNIK